MVESSTLEDKTKKVRKGIRFVEVLKWLDKSIFAPILTEKSMQFLYHLSYALDEIGQRRTDESENSSENM